MKERSIATALVGLCLVLAGTARPAPAQVSRNVQLMANWKPPSGRLNDIWGYRSPGGKEYCIVGSTTGSYILDCTNPSQPIQRAFIAGPSSTWRDMKTYGAYAYIVTEGGSGMQIVDLTNPDQPRLVKTWGPWPNAHNIAMDEGTGVAIPCGTRTGMHWVDVKTDPVNPQLIGTMRTPYIHDLHQQHGYAYLAELYGNTFMILDVRSLPSTTTLSRVGAPGTRYCHSAWADDEDNYAVTTNETASGPLGIWDVRDKRNPRLIARYAAGPSTAIIHNAFIKDRVCHISHYTEGYRAVDLSVPSSPVEVGYYDTYPGASQGYNGNWGCYCEQPSGIVYASDRSTGLFILKPKAAAIRYGQGTPGTGGKLPRIRPFGAAYLGNAAFKLEAMDGKPSSGATLLLGLLKANLNVNGLRVNVVPAALFPAATDPSGKVSLPMPVPNVAALDGLVLYAQYFVNDPGGILGLSATQGLEFVLFLK